jgi:hypothetical protein
MAAGVDRVVVSAADFRASGVSLGDELGEDALCGTFGDSDLLCDVACTGLGVRVLDRERFGQSVRPLSRFCLCLAKFVEAIGDELLEARNVAKTRDEIRPRVVGGRDDIDVVAAVEPLEDAPCAGHHLRDV